MGILSWVVWGLFVGAIARLLRKGHQPIGLLWTMILGIAGSLIGGFFATKVIDIADSNDFDFGSFLIAVGTSFLLLALYEPIARRREQKQQPGPGQPV
ncbi:MAG TPA: GlsB/YeaQ/YmgE family stress response membrane protein [Gaiellales bacterium]|nr:GlsB/YeaQ/YmgE family stress response membrane protein [Gaiellales bacterium]